MKKLSRILISVINLAFIASLIPATGLAQTSRNGSNQEPLPPPAYTVTADYNLFLPSVAQFTSNPTLFGVEMDSVSEGTLLDMATQAQVKWVRRNGVFWDQIEPTQGVRDWSSLATLESEMALLSQSGMQLVLIVRGVPDWARTDDGYRCGPIAQNKFGAFASFMRELVSRYSRPPYNVRYWELGNEPDSPFISNTSPFGCWGEPSNRYYGGGNYGKMLKAVYPAIKSANQNAQVLVGGLLMDCDPNYPPPGRSCSMSKFLEGILQEGAGDSFDGVSFHSYDYYYSSLGAYGNPNWQATSTTTGPTVEIKARYLASVLANYGQSHKYLLATETALLCNINVQDCGEEYELTKAIYATQNYVVSLVTGLSASIWYSYTNPWRYTNLIESSNPKPAYHAFHSVSEKLAHTRYRQNIPIDGLSVYEFIRNGDRIWVVWSLDGQDHNLTLPDLPDRMWDLYGNAVPVRSGINIGVEPVYLEWDD